VFINGRSTLEKSPSNSAAVGMKTFEKKLPGASSMDVSENCSLLDDGVMLLRNAK